MRKNPEPAEDREKRLEVARLYYQNNKDKLKEQHRVYREKNKQKTSETNRIYRERNRDSLIEKSRRFYDLNRDVIIEKARKKRYANIEEYRSKRREYYARNKDHINRYQKERNHYQDNLQSKYNIYKRSSAKRGIGFYLSVEEFGTHWEGICNYCGDRIKTIGVDRICSDEGYTVSNTVSCCWICNRMKQSMEYKAFLGHITKIFKRRNNE